MSLLLRSVDVNGFNSVNVPYIYTNSGYSTGSRTKLYFYINLEAVVGKEEYKNNDEFLLELTQLQVSSKQFGDGTTFGGYMANAVLNLSYVLSGLEFYNSSSRTTEICQFTVNITGGYINFVVNFPKSRAYFKKPSNPNITLGLELFANNSDIDNFIPSSWTTSSAHTFQHTNFHINVMGTKNPLKAINDFFINI